MKRPFGVFVLAFVAAGCDKLVSLAADAGGSDALSVDGSTTRDAAPDAALADAVAVTNDGGDVAVADRDARGGGDGATGAGGCPFVSGAASVGAAQTAVTELARGNAMAQNLTELDRVALSAGTTLALAPNGDVAALTRNGATLTFHPVAPVGPPSVVTSAARSNATPVLFFNGRSEPLVVQIGGTPRMTESTRRGDNSWAQRDVSQGLPPEEPTVIGAGTTPDGAAHVFMRSGLGTNMSVTHAQRPAGSEAWMTERLPSPGAGPDFHVSIGPDGRFHITHRDTRTPCDPCDVGLYYGQLQNGAWTRETVHAGVWGPPQDELHSAPELGFDAMGRPIIVAQFVRRVESGSLVSSSLRAYVRTGPGVFCHETIAERSDRFEGDLGGGFTGATPRVSLKPDGSFAVAFRDLAVWHDGMGRENSMAGQLRVATRGANGWQVTRALEQPGRGASMNPLHGASSPSIVATRDGFFALTTTQRWGTDSIFNLRSVPVDQSAVIVRIGPR